MTRWLPALGWTALLLILMLSPGDSSQVDDISTTFGGSDLTDAIGHVVLFAVCVGLWHNVYPLPISATIGFFLGTTTELAQELIPARGAVWFDFVANYLGVLLGAAVLWVYYHYRSAPEKKASNDDIGY